MSNKMWGGRFAAGPDAILEEINASIDFDRHLFAQDIAGSKAHASMLAAQGIITAADADKIAQGLDTILAEIESGAFELPAFDSADIGAALRVIERYSDFPLGLADASLVVLSERYRTLSLLTLDERHFRTLRGHRGLPFELIPEPR